MKLLITLLLMVSNGFYNAINEGNTITIVEDKLHTSNTIWYQNHLDLNQDFNLDFKIYLGSKYNRGDGATFILNSSTQDPEKLIGGKGGLIGALDLPNSLVFEFDTYFNITNNGLESDTDTQIPGGHQEKGHLGIVETNNTTKKHSKHAYSNHETLGDSTLRKVSVKWDSTTKIISYHVSGYEVISHSVNISDVFSGETKIRFGFSSSNGLKKASTYVTDINYPHQVDINELSLEDTPETKTYTYELKNKIEHGNQVFNQLNLQSNDKINNQVLVNDSMVIVNDGSIDLSGFTESNLTVKVSIDKNQDEKNILELNYQGQTFQSESNWSHEWTEITPSDPGIPLAPLEPSKPNEPEVPLIPLEPSKPMKPTEPGVPEIPQTPLDPPKHIEPIEPEVPLVPDLPSHPVIPKVPVAPVKPSNKPSKDNVKDETKKDSIKKPSFPKNDTSDNIGDSILKPDDIKPIFKHRILDNNENSNSSWDNLPYVEFNSGKDSLIFFSSGDHGVFITNENELSLNNNGNLSIPYPVVNEGYEFIGFQNEAGEFIDDASFKSNEKYTAIYRKITLAHKDNDKKRNESIMLLFVSFFLLILRWGLNRDIRIREEKKHG